VIHTISCFFNFPQVCLLSPLAVHWFFFCYLFARFSFRFFSLISGRFYGDFPVCLVPPPAKSTVIKHPFLFSVCYEAFFFSIFFGHRFFQSPPPEVPVADSSPLFGLCSSPLLSLNRYLRWPCFWHSSINLHRRRRLEHTPNLPSFLFPNAQIDPFLTPQIFVVPELIPIACWRSMELHSHWNPALRSCSPLFRTAMRMKTDFFLSSCVGPP